MSLGAYLKDGLVLMDMKTILNHGISCVRKQTKIAHTHHYCRDIEKAIIHISRKTTIIIFQLKRRKSWPLTSTKQGYECFFPAHG